jgi:hypothetical protein
MCAQIVTNRPYPWRAANVDIRQELTGTTVYWQDTHALLDPIQYLITCNKDDYPYDVVYRNTSYRCPAILDDNIDTISIKSEVFLPTLAPQYTNIVDVYGRKDSVCLNSSQ